MSCHKVYSKLRDPTGTTIGAALAQGEAMVCTREAWVRAHTAKRASTEACQEYHPDRS
eukprot:COSAG05_NODE_15386_length_371_cov_0.647059_1_plen_58_part_10